MENNLWNFFRTRAGRHGEKFVVPDHERGLTGKKLWRVPLALTTGTHVVRSTPPPYPTNSVRGTSYHWCPSAAGQLDANSRSPVSPCASAVRGCPGLSDLGAIFHGQVPKTPERRRYSNRIARCEMRWSNAITGSDIGRRCFVLRLATLWWIGANSDTMPTSDS